MSGTTLNTESNSVFNFDETSTINNDGDTNYSSSSTITTSGTTINYGGATTVDFGGDTTVTFGGNTTFNSPTYFTSTTSGICHSDLDCLDSDDHLQYVPRDGSRGFTSTVSGIYPTQSYHLTTKQYVDENVKVHKTGRIALAQNDDSKSVVFSEPFDDANYSISLMMRNAVDASPSIYPMIVTTTTASGFSVLFSGDIDSANYYLEYIAVNDE
jgi:hypothetical protein